MNFTDSPYERMMKQVPRPSRHDLEPCPACRERGGDCRKKRRTLIVEPAGLRAKLARSGDVPGADP